MKVDAHRALNTGDATDYVLTTERFLAGLLSFCRDVGGTLGEDHGAKKWTVNNIFLFQDVFFRLVDKFGTP